MALDWKKRHQVFYGDALILVVADCLPCHTLMGARGFQAIGIESPLVNDKDGKDILAPSADNPWGAFAIALPEKRGGSVFNIVADFHPDHFYRSAMIRG